MADNSSYQNDTYRSVIERHGFAVSKTAGASMRPLIWGGQHCVTVVPLRDKPAVGELLMFMQTLPDESSRRLVHRLVAIEEDGNQRVYLTRGDNCITCERVKPNEIIGKVSEIHRTTGYRPWYALPWRKFSVHNPSYRLYTRLWLLSYPLRRPLYLLRGHLKGLYSRLLRIRH